MATMRDVAELAGVSLATVSRALSGSRRVQPELVERVREASDTLGYRRNLLARGLRRRHTDTIGVVVPQAGDLRHARLVQALSRTLHDRGESLLMGDGHGDVDIEAEAMRRLIDRSVDGMIIVPLDSERSGAAVREVAEHVHVVQVERAVGADDIDLVGVDEAAGMRLVLSHLSELDRERTVFVAGSHLESEGASDRLEAYREGAATGRTRAVATPLLGIGGLAWGREAVGRLAVTNRWPDAIVCGDDLTALGVLDGLRAAGVRVPDDIVVTGFDDVGLAEVGSPPLTTVRRPLVQVADAAIERLDGARRGESGAAVAWRLLPSLVVRQSTVATAPEGSTR